MADWNVFTKIKLLNMADWNVFTKIKLLNMADWNVFTKTFAHRLHRMCSLILSTCRRFEKRVTAVFSPILMTCPYRRDDGNKSLSMQVGYSMSPVWTGLSVL